MKKIATEEHYFTQYFVEYMQSRETYPMVERFVDENGQQLWRWRKSAKEHHIWLPEPHINKLCDIGEGRLRDMDEAGVDMQVLSFNVNVDEFNAAEATSLARNINDVISEAVHKHPNRYAGFAALALKDANMAADELERAVKRLGLKGTMIVPHVEGEFIDAKKYWPVFQVAARLGVPIYIHPHHPPPNRMEQYSGYPQLRGAMWGFGAETGLAAVRLICSGVFDEYPDLKIILGHMGEALPFWMWRLDDRVKTSADSLLSNRDIESGIDPTPLTKKLKKLPSQYIRDNFFVTISGMLWEPVLHLAQKAMGTEKILFATDYPFMTMPESVQFMETVQISSSDKEKIYHTNAEHLLGL